jgi:hypothetical protein
LTDFWSKCEHLNALCASAVEHLAKTVLLSAWRGSTWVFMATIELSSAYFDESRLNGSFPVVAGFWSPINVWLYCDELLKRALRDKPERLAAKKYVREHSLQFAKLLTVLDLLPIFATLERKAFAPIFDSKGSGKLLFSNAYTSCAYSCCQLLDLHGLELAWRKPIKVVFDDGAEDKISLERGYRKYYASKTDSLLSKTPLFQDDEGTLPLLAADLYAWLLSKKYNSDISGEEAQALNVLHFSSSIFIELDEGHAQQILDES